MISTKGRYGIRVMIDLAEHQREGRIPLKDIAERQGISKKYLEIVVRDLVQGELISGTSGKGGGYSLTRPPEDYTILEILELLEGTLAPVACLSGAKKDCPRESFCRTLPMWREFDDMVQDFFASRKLSDLL